MSLLLKVGANPHSLLYQEGGLHSSASSTTTADTSDDGRPYASHRPATTYSGCYGLPYQDHNYGAPPPPTPPASPPPAPPPKLNGHIDIDNVSCHTTVITSGAAQAAAGQHSPAGVPQPSLPSGGQDQDDSITRCVCDFEHDDGYMICCDRCGVWQHVDCMGVDRANIPDSYMCEKCQPRKIDRQHARQLQIRKRELLGIDTSATETEDETPHGKSKKKAKTKRKKDKKEGSTTEKQQNLAKKSKKFTGKDKRPTKVTSPNSKKVKIPIISAKKSPVKPKLPKSPVVSPKANGDSPREPPITDRADTYEEARSNQYSSELHQLVAAQRINGSRDSVTTPDPADSIQLLDPLAKVAQVTNKHKGLEASEDLITNTPVIEYRGRVILREQYQQQHPIKIRIPPFVLFYSKLDNTELCIDATTYGNEARFVRRSCTPNAEIRHIVENGSIHFLIYTSRGICKGSEITIPYDYPYQDSPGPVDCACSRSHCPVTKFFKRGTESQPRPTKRRRRKSSRNVDEMIEAIGSPPQKAAPSPPASPPPEPLPSPVPATPPPASPPTPVPPSPQAKSPSLSPPPRHINKRRKTSPMRPKPPASSLNEDASVELPQPTLEKAKSEDADIEMAVEERTGPETRQSHNSSSNIEQDITSPTETNSDLEEHHKMTREERKMEAIMKAIERMERREERRKKEADTKVEVKPRPKGRPSSSSTEEKKQEKEKMEEEKKDEPKEIKETKEVKIKKPVRKRRPSAPARRRSRANSGMSTRTTDNEMTSADEAPPGSTTPPASTPTTPPSSTPTRTPTNNTASSEPPTPVTSTPIPPADKGFMFHKTKKLLMNEWLNDRSNDLHPLSIHTDSADQSAITPAPMDPPAAPIPAAEEEEADFVRCLPSPHTRSLNHLRRNSGSTGSNFRNNKPLETKGFTKKRWLRQAMSESGSVSDLSPSPMGAMSPITNGGMSPNTNSCTNSPGAPSPADFVTPLKKRRLARESLALENSCPTTPSTPLLTTTAHEVFHSPPSLSDIDTLVPDTDQQTQESDKTHNDANHLCNGFSDIIPPAVSVYERLRYRRHCSGDGLHGSVSSNNQKFSDVNTPDSLHSANHLPNSFFRKPETISKPPSVVESSPKIEVTEEFKTETSPVKLSVADCTEVKDETVCVNSMIAESEWSKPEPSFGACVKLELKTECDDIKEEGLPGCGITSSTMAGARLHTIPEEAADSGSSLRCPYPASVGGVMDQREADTDSVVSPSRRVDTDSVLSPCQSADEAASSSCSPCRHCRGSHSGDAVTSPCVDCRAARAVPSTSQHARSWNLAHTAYQRVTDSVTPRCELSTVRSSSPCHGESSVQSSEQSGIRFSNSPSSVQSSVLSNINNSPGHASSSVPTIGETDQCDSCSQSVDSHTCPALGDGTQADSQAGRTTPRTSLDGTQADSQAGRTTLRTSVDGTQADSQAGRVTPQPSGDGQVADSQAGRVILQALSEGQQADSQAGQVPQCADSQALEVPQCADSQAGQVPRCADSQAGEAPQCADSQAGQAPQCADSQTNNADTDQEMEVASNSSTKVKLDSVCDSTEQQTEISDGQNEIVGSEQNDSGLAGDASSSRDSGLNSEGERTCSSSTDQQTSDTDVLAVGVVAADSGLDTDSETVVCRSEEAILPGACPAPTSSRADRSEGELESSFELCSMNQEAPSSSRVGVSSALDSSFAIAESDTGEVTDSDQGESRGGVSCSSSRPIEVEVASEKEEGEITDDETEEEDERSVTQGMSGEAIPTDPRSRPPPHLASSEALANSSWTSYPGPPFNFPPPGWQQDSHKYNGSKYGHSDQRWNAGPSAGASSSSSHYGGHFDQAGPCVDSTSESRNRPDEPEGGEPDGGDSVTSSSLYGSGDVNMENMSGKLVSSSEEVYRGYDQEDPTSPGSSYPTSSQHSHAQSKKKVSLLEYRKRMKYPPSSSRSSSFNNVRERSHSRGSSSSAPSTPPPPPPRNSKTPTSLTPILTLLKQQHSPNTEKKEEDVKWNATPTSAEIAREQTQLSLTERLRREFGLDPSESEDEADKSQGEIEPPPPPPPATTASYHHPGQSLSQHLPSHHPPGSMMAAPMPIMPPPIPPSMLGIPLPRMGPSMAMPSMPQAIPPQRPVLRSGISQQGQNMPPPPGQSMPLPQVQSMPQGQTLPQVQTMPPPVHPGQQITRPQMPMLPPGQQRTMPTSGPPPTHSAQTIAPGQAIVRQPLSQQGQVLPGQVLPPMTAQGGIQQIGAGVPTAGQSQMSVSQAMTTHAMVSQTSAMPSHSAHSSAMQSNSVVSSQAAPHPGQVPPHPGMMPAPPGCIPNIMTMHRFSSQQFHNRSTETTQPDTTLTPQGQLSAPPSHNQYPSNSQPYNIPHSTQPPHNLPASYHPSYPTTTTTYQPR